VEEALGLMEELGELERVHRLAPLLLGKLTAADRRLVARALPRLLRLRSLDRQDREEDGEARTRLAEERQREQRLLAETLGAERQRVPELLGSARSAEEQDTLLLLLGLALRAEELADAGVAAADPGRRAKLEAQVRGLHGQFAGTLDEAVAARAPGRPLGLLGALAARPAAVADLVEALPEGEALARVWRFGTAGKAAGRAPWLAVLLTADAFEVVSAASAEELVEKASAWAFARDGARLTLAYEDPAAFLQAPAGTTLALSGTHWLRSFGLRRPFRSALLVLPGPAGGQPEKAPLESQYRLLAPAASASPATTDPGTAALQLLPLAHTVAVAGPVVLGSAVPTRSGETGSPTLVAALEEGSPLPLAELLDGLPRASLAAFSGLPPRLWYEAGHLLTLAGVATTAVPRPGAAADLDRLLERYSTDSATTSAAATGWLLLGYGGMTPEQAAAYAVEKFTAYARAAETAFGAGRYPEAAATLEDALLVAEQTPALGQHLPELHRFAREATFAAGDLARSAHHAAALVTYWENTRPDSEEHADALLRLGLVLARQERFDRALPALQEAVEMLADLELTAQAAEALASMGVVLENATEYDRALESFGTAADLEAELDRDDLVAAQQVNIGRLYDLRLSRWARAKQHYLQALELYDASGNLPGVIQALLDTGRCERLLGNFPAAAERFGLARELLAEEPDPVLEAKVEMEQANNAWFQGRYQEAFERQQKVLATARAEGWALGEVLARNTGGLTWWTLGDNARALRELQRALEQATALEGRADEVATTLNNIGLVQREQGRFDDALVTLNRALEIDRRLQSRWAIAYDLRNIGLTLLRRGDAHAALPPLQEAAAEAEAIGDRVNEAKARLALAEARWALGERAAAGSFYLQALDLSRDMVLRETEWRALHGLARVRLAAGDAAGARELLYEAVAVVEGMRAAIKLEQLRDGFLTDKLDAYRLLVKVLVDQGESEQAFTVAERSRSRNFIDLLGNQRLTLRGAVEQDLYDRQQALQARREEHEALLAQAETDAERTAYRQALAALADEQTDLMLNIQLANPELASLVSVQPVDARQVRERLEPGVAVLAYYLLDDELLCWVLRDDRLALVRTPLSREALQEDIFAYRRLIQNLEPLADTSRDLYARLIEPLLPELAGVRTLGIIPHGPLHYLSFATLGDQEGYLVESFPLFYLPSASVLGYTLERRQAEPNRTVLAIGNPDLGAVSLELPFAEQEVGAIRWDFPEVTVLTGEKATESWVVRHLGEFGIIHLASHGEFDPVNPLFSALKLARGEETDGDLQAAEVFGLELNADLVVLSACQTGVGKVTGGDDVIGLNRAFFYAGTHAIVSSLWRVSDVSTAVLMKQFYRQLGRDRSKAASLRAAMLHVKTRYPHPGYWGAFTLSGDYQ
jgi:CHAT domain-containing protein